MLPISCPSCPLPHGTLNPVPIPFQSASARRCSEYASNSLGPSFLWGCVGTKIGARCVVTLVGMRRWSCVPLSISTVPRLPGRVILRGPCGLARRLLPIFRAYSSSQAPLCRRCEHRLDVWGRAADRNAPRPAFAGSWGHCVRIWCVSALVLAGGAFLAPFRARVPVVAGFLRAGVVQGLCRGLAPLVRERLLHLYGWVFDCKGSQAFDEDPCWPAGPYALVEEVQCLSVHGYLHHDRA